MIDIDKEILIFSEDVIARIGKYIELTATQKREDSAKAASELMHSLTSIILMAADFSFKEDEHFENALCIICDNIKFLAINQLRRRNGEESMH